MAIARGWRGVFWRVWTQLGRHHVTVVAAGVAFYAMLSLFPGITSLISLFGLFADPRQVSEQFALMRDLMPAEAWQILNDQLQAVTTAQDERLGLGAAVSSLIALWTAGAGVRALMTALNVAYREEETRSIIGFNLMAFIFTIGVIAAAVFSITVIVILPILVKTLPFGPLERVVIRLVPWTVLTLFVMLTLGLLYRYGPCRPGRKEAWMSPGAIVATLLWLIVSFAFSLYVEHFPGYSQAYGAIGAVMVLLVWLWLTTYVVLLGATLNAEIKERARRLKEERRALEDASPDPGETAEGVA